MRAGIPTIAIPNPEGDQPFWARRLHELDASAATIPHRKLTADLLAEAIHIALTDRQLRDTTQQLAGRIAGEDGAAHVTATVESLLHQPT